jgi:hypothetical protein
MLRARNDTRVAACELLPLVVAASIELEAALEVIDEAVARHSLVTTVRASLLRLREELAALAVASPAV